MRIFSVPPPIKDNPYQHLLYGALAEAGGQISEPQKLGVRHPASAPAEGGILHVHWLWLKGGGLRRRFEARRWRTRLEGARARGWHIVWTAHNLVPHDGDALDRSVYVHLAGIADGIIAHSQLAADQVRDHYAPSVPIAVIPHGHYRGVHAEPPDVETCRKTLDLPSDAQVLLAFGQVRPYKGFVELARAFSGLPGDHLRLVIAGRPDGPLIVRELERLAAADPRLVLRLGFIDDDEVPLLFGAADWTALPYRRATTSGTLALAFTFASPVIAPADGPVTEGTEPAALELFHSDEDLGPAIARALVRDRAAAAAAARRTADGLDWEPIAARTLAFFEQVLGR